MAVGGGVTFLALLAIGAAVTGSIGAVAIFLALVVAVLTVGLLAATGVASWQGRRGAPSRCSTCNRPLRSIGEFRVCESCDQIVVGS